MLLLSSPHKLGQILEEWDDTWLKHSAYPPPHRAEQMIGYESSHQELENKCVTPKKNKFWWHKLLKT